MRVTRHIRSLATVVAFATLGLTGVWSSQAKAEGPVSFKDDVFPIIQLRCQKCHAPGEQGYETSGLDLTSYDGLMKGTKHGPVISPGNAFMSNLNVLIEGRAAANLRMPHDGRKLTRCEIDIFRRWVNHGAKDD